MSKTPNTIVIVGGESNNQAKLTTQLEPVKVSDNVGLAITSIFHGAVYNINESNNMVSFYAAGKAVLYTSKIPIGHYSSSFAVLKSISDVLERRDYLDISSMSKPRLDVTLRGDNSLSVSIEHMGLAINDKQNSPWKMLGVDSIFESASNFNIKNVNFDLNLEPGFLYANIVEDSWINGRRSRVLDMVPISMKAHWSYYEFSSPNFVPIDVKEFSKIHLELRNMDGEYVPFDPSFKTIITLQTKHINREEAR